MIRVVGTRATYTTSPPSSTEIEADSCTFSLSDSRNGWPICCTLSDER